MTFRVHRRLLSQLIEVDKDRDKLEAALWAKTGGVCFLCEDKINRAADDYEADHDEPEADGGETTVANLHLAHVACNRMKRASNSRHIRPFIKFSRYLSKAATRIKYDGTLEFFSIVPAPTEVTLATDTAEFKFPDGSERSVGIMRESNEAGDFAYVYVDVPRTAIYNDEDCQPRVIKREQVGAIFGDLRRNPLHEPPSVRLSAAAEGLRELLMFDGQHKTVANWLMGRDRVVVKVYLDLSPEAAIELVNSIQAKIKKLPLSPFELASKLSEEWEDKLSIYELEVGEENASEAGFIQWVPADDRTRAKQAFRSALIQRLLGDPLLRLSQYAKGSEESTIVELPEALIRSKVLEKLVSTDPVALKGDELSKFRDSEAQNIIRLLNHFTDAAYEPQGDGQMSDVERERARRLSYQSSLAYVAGLMRDLWGHVAMKGNNAKFALSDELTADQWKRITDGIDLLVAHPAWVSEFDTDRMRTLKLALEKNQNIQKAFDGVALDLPYVVMGGTTSGYKEAWE